jgi:hypothetical protein
MTAKKTKTGSDLCPHVCRCGSACYIGGDNTIKCVNPLCSYYHEQTLIDFQREYYKREREAAADLLGEDEPTEPQAKSIPQTLLIEPTYDEAWTKYVDAWGPMLGIPKDENEDDDQYRQRILEALDHKPGKSKMVPVIHGIEPDDSKIEVCLKRIKPLPTKINIVSTPNNSDARFGEWWRADDVESVFCNDVLGIPYDPKDYDK